LRLYKLSPYRVDDVSKGNWDSITAVAGAGASSTQVVCDLSLPFFGPQCPVENLPLTKPSKKEAETGCAFLMIG
jgi:hypothetical protein